jgi:hypothetical protein
VAEILKDVLELAGVASAIASSAAQLEAFASRIGTDFASRLGGAMRDLAEDLEAGRIALSPDQDASITAAIQQTASLLKPFAEALGRVASGFARKDQVDAMVHMVAQLERALPT